MDPDPPLRMRMGIIFDQGHLARPWAPDLGAMRAIDGKTFFSVKRIDRGFARAMGLDMTLKTPWSDVSFLDYLTFLRNKAVDQMILQKQTEVDDEHSCVPMHPTRSPGMNCMRAWTRYSL